MKSFEILKDHHEQCYRKLQKTGLFPEVVIAKTGDPVPLMVKNHKKMYIHSRFDPQKEAERFIDQAAASGITLYIVLGFGFAYHIETLLKKIDNNTMVMVIDNDPALLKCALENRDLTDLVNDERLILLCDPDEESISQALRGRSSKSVSIITHRGTSQLDPDYYINIAEICRSYISTKDVNIATLAKFEKLWSLNIARNIKCFIESPGIINFFDSFKDVSAVVVGAGPSLRSSLPLLKKMQTRVVIIAVDTAYKLLLKEGIEPHFCVAVDPQVINARYFEDLVPGRTILIHEPAVHPSVLRFFKGRTITAGIAFNLLKWIEKMTDSKGEITHGGSVSTNAYDFAYRCGFKQIFLVGQDMGFTDNLAHARGSYLDEQIFLRLDRFNTPENFNRRQLSALPPIFVQGIQGEKIQTNQKMMIFLNWFEKRSNENIINMTHDGAIIKGITSEIPDIDNMQEIDLWYTIDQYYNRGNKTTIASVRDKYIKEITFFLQELDSLSPRFKTAVTQAEQLVKLLSGQGRDQGKINYVLKKLDAVDAAVEACGRVKDMLSFVSQRVIHTITEEYEVEGEGEDDVAIAQRSLFLYKGFFESSVFLKKVFHKMLGALK
jgi:hypothetical protein